MTFNSVALQFNLRATFIVIAWLSAIFAIPGYLYRSGLLPGYVGVYLTVVIVGSLVGTIYGAILRRPERNRWIRSLVIGAVFGLLPLGIQYSQYLFFPLAWFLAFLISLLPAFVAACLTELLRLLLKRFACTDALEVQSCCVGQHEHVR